MTTRIYKAKDGQNYEVYERIAKCFPYPTYIRGNEKISMNLYCVRDGVIIAKRGRNTSPLEIMGKSKSISCLVKSIERVINKKLAEVKD